jgi:hypothetical protein
MVTGLVSCFAHRLQLSQQFKICGFLEIVSVSNPPSANLKPPHDEVLCTFANLLDVIVSALL